MIDDHFSFIGFSTNSKPWLRINDNYKTINAEAEKATNNTYYKSFLSVTNLRRWPAVKKGSLETRLLSNNVLAFSR